jgi:hypothetical protein
LSAERMERVRHPQKVRRGAGSICIQDRVRSAWRKARSACRRRRTPAPAWS